MITFNFCSSLMWNVVKPDGYYRHDTETMLTCIVEDIPSTLLDLVWDKFNKETYINALCESSLAVYIEIFCNIPSLVFEEKYESSSPKEYNFATDEVCVTARLSKADLEMLENEMFADETKASEYLSKFNRSRDGFISFMPATISELKKEKENDLDKYIAVLLDFYVYSRQDLSIGMQEVIFGNYFMDNYCDSDFFTLDVNIINDFIDNYNKEKDRYPNYYERIFNGLKEELATEHEYDYYFVTECQKRFHELTA